MKSARVVLVGLAVLAAAILVGGGLVSRRTTGGTPVRTVRVAAASDLRYALPVLVDAFRERHRGIGVQIAYGSSGTFVAQLFNGAPFDLFMSADIDYPRQIEARGLAAAASEFVYAIGHLVVWVPADSPIDIGAAGVDVLGDPRIARIAIANPEHAPYGRAAEEALRRSGIYERVKDKLVLGDTVAQALQFVQSGAAQAGIVGLSLAAAPVVDKTGKYWVVPETLHTRLEQGGIIMQAAADMDAAQAFRGFVLSAEGRDVLARFGFSLSAT
jgi:molybdate transport system substrate-binding protein